MNDATDKPEEESPSDEPQGPVGGERLAAARREQQISVQEIAKELHLDEPKVRALERNEFDVLGAPVFAKGHLRKYAQLVAVDESDIMADYYQLNRAGGMPPLVSSRRRTRREMSPGPWIAVIVVLIVVATAYWWFTSGPAVTDEPQLDLIRQEASTEPEPEAEQEVTDVGADDSAVLESAGEKPEPEASAAEAEQMPALVDGQMRMLLSYTGDCWTEISDAGGRRLFFGLGKDGRTVELSGEAPFNVLFGNADNVLMQVNGIEREIAAEERRGRTARLTITGT
jgi:cytoskeleton protein RodZ